LPDEYTAGDERPSGAGRKWLAWSMLGLSGAGMLAGASVPVAAHLPVCQQSQQVVGWEQGRPCLASDLAVGGATARRYASLPFHLGDQMEAWRSGNHQVFAAPANAPRLGNSEEQLKVVSWNLHHGLSQDSTGARPQRDTMIEHLQREDADVVLLQEVAPGDADDLAEALGMQGYYAGSTPVQGNMILLRPDMKVNHQSVTYTTGQSGEDSWGTLKDWVFNQGGASEPRNLQILKVEMPNGQPALIWNTHHVTHQYSDQQKEAAARAMVGALRENLDYGELMVGGGDLNVSDPNHPLIQDLNQLPGVSGQQRNLDWIYASDSSQAQFSGQVVESDGIMVSDHPLVRAHLMLTEKV
jgi:endonuclease/exonuclease/phosphatase family metal-dependent hydrolase